MKNFNVKEYQSKYQKAYRLIGDNAEKKNEYCRKWRLEKKALAEKEKKKNTEALRIQVNRFNLLNKK